MRLILRHMLLLFLLIFDSCQYTSYSFLDAILMEEKIVSLEISSPDFEYNHSVGNSWGHFAYYNGKLLEFNTIYEIKYKTPIVLSVRLKSIEYDSVDDISIEDFIISIDDINKNSIIIKNLIVKENRGRYAGNTAKINYTFCFSGN